MKVVVSRLVLKTGNDIQKIDTHTYKHTHVCKAIGISVPKLQ